ncbi:hypothetical protein [Streptomyces spirodelae]|uniref:Glycosyltransferase RgtA/B/C/D-like domain-containing protein n=1 Tax=Streptomyces spirodelae TaxID=2812904 RepID=A0ABS3X3R3_9ACTN|nr:hypothetical protein [Streptomyces spirodelae]MBO8190020.1 hypothetical protein [Streptomyces spirodelae]
MSSFVRVDRRWLAAACAAFGALSLAIVPPELPLGWDELVYASRFPAFGPETPFSAPRTRGAPLLIAPVAAISDSVVLLRCYLTVVASLALYLGYLPWVRAVGRRWVVPLAAALYSSVWFALFYAGAAMPNHYVAMGLTGAVGCCVRPAAAEPRSRTYAAMALALGGATLMRPNDTVGPAAVLLVAATWAVGRGRLSRARAARGSAALAGGLLLGVLPWAVEARLRFGSVLERVREAGEIQGGMRPHLSLHTLWQHAAALDGPLLCRPCTGVDVGWASAGWWLLVPPLVALGIRAARRDGRTALALLPVLAAVAVAAPYLFLMNYAAPRFLLPCYALLAPVAALGVSSALRWARRAGRLRVLVPLGAAVALPHLAFQLHQLQLHSGIQAAARHDWQRMEGVLRAHGVRPPCLLAGNSSTVPVAHTAGCRPASVGRPHALVLRQVPLPAWAARAGWHLHPVPGTYNPGWRVAVPPRRVVSPAALSAVPTAPARTSAQNHRSAVADSGGQAPQEFQIRR